MLVYEYVMDMATDSNLWQMMKRTVATKTVNNISDSRNRTLLLGGRKDGYICVYNWDTGAVDFKVEVCMIFLGFYCSVDLLVFAWWMM